MKDPNSLDLLGTEYVPTFDGTQVCFSLQTEWAFNSPPICLTIGTVIVVHCPLLGVNVH